MFLRRLWFDIGVDRRAWAWSHRCSLMHGYLWFRIAMFDSISYCTICCMQRMPNCPTFSSCKCPMNSSSSVGRGAAAGEADYLSYMLRLLITIIAWWCLIRQGNFIIYQSHSFLYMPVSIRAWFDCLELLKSVDMVGGYMTKCNKYVCDIC